MSDQSDKDEKPWAARLVDGGDGGGDEAADAPPPPYSKLPAEEEKAAADVEPIAAKKEKLKKLKLQPAKPQKAKKKKKREQSDDDNGSAASFNEPDDEEDDYKPEVCVRLAFNRLVQYSSRLLLEEKAEKIDATRKHFVERRHCFCNAKARQRCEHRHTAEKKGQRQIGDRRFASKIFDCKSCETQESCKRGRRGSLALVRCIFFSF